MPQKRTDPAVEEEPKNNLREEFNNKALVEEEVPLKGDPHDPVEKLEEEITCHKAKLKKKRRAKQYAAIQEANRVIGTVSGILSDWCCGEFYDYDDIVAEMRNMRDTIKQFPKWNKHFGPWDGES